VDRAKRRAAVALIDPNEQDPLYKAGSDTKPRQNRLSRYFRIADFTSGPKADRARNRRFESISLQRRVRLSPGAAFEGREPRLTARLCGAGLATGSAETRRVVQDRANRRPYLCRAIFQYRSAADGVGENATSVPIKSGRFAEVDRCPRTEAQPKPNTMR